MYEVNSNATTIVTTKGTYTSLAKPQSVAALILTVLTHGLSERWTNAQDNARQNVFEARY